jgi:hypothetical protein
MLLQPSNLAVNGTHEALPIRIRVAFPPKLVPDKFVKRFRPDAFSTPPPTGTRDVDAILFVSQKHPPSSDDRFLVRKIDLDRDCEFSGGLQPG